MRVVRLFAVACLVAMFAVLVPSTAHAGTARLANGTVGLQWDYSTPIGPSDIRVIAAACPAQDYVSLGVNCFTTASAVHAFGTFDSEFDDMANGSAVSSWNYEISLDSAVDWEVGVFADIDLDPTSAFTRNRLVYDATQFKYVAADPNAAPVDLSPTELNTPYVHLSGNVVHTGPSTDLYGVGACPAANLFDGRQCNGIALSFSSDHTYFLNLWPGNYKAAGFYLQPPATPILGITNLLSFPSPASVADANPALDFNADISYNSPAVEQGAPNNGDGNYDGTADINEPNVTSMVIENGNYVTIATDTAQVFTAVAQPLNALQSPTPPAGFPAGIGAFTVVAPSIGGYATIDLFFRDLPPTGTDFWKWVNGGWQTYPATVISTPPAALHLRISLRDGGPADYDGTANGFISDPFAFVSLYQVSALTSVVNGNTATLSWTMTLGGEDVASTPPGTSLVVRCPHAATDLTSQIDAHGDGTFTALYSGPINRLCDAKLKVPTLPLGTSITRHTRLP